MSWIKTDFDFGVPYVIFTVGMREVAVACQIRDTLKTFQERPEEIEKYLLGLVEFHRPTLKGGSIIAIRYSMGGMQFEIDYIHPNLPRCPTFNQPVPVPLISRERQVGALQVVDEAVGMEDSRKDYKEWARLLHDVTAPQEDNEFYRVGGSNG